MSRTRRSLLFLPMLALVPASAIDIDTPPVGAGSPMRADVELPPGISGDWWTKVQQEIQQSEYHITWQEPTALLDPSSSPGHASAAAYQAPNRAQDLRTYFSPDGIRVVPRRLGGEGGESSPWEWGLELTAYAETRVGPAQLVVSGNRIEYRRGDITEWYLNDERGLEQGFTLATQPRPSGSNLRSPITLEMAVSGDLAATMSEDGQAIEFNTPDGVRVVRYGGLLAQDASGRELPATMEIADASLRLVVDAGSATYPITIDPVVTSPNWAKEGNQAYASYGHAVATAGDVNGDGYADVIVGAPYFDNGQSGEGRVWVYHGSARGLSIANFRAESNQEGANYGFAVATAGDVNGDGYDDVIVGAPLWANPHWHEGRVWVYHGSGNGLIPFAAFRAESNQAGAEYGHAVATAGDVNGDGYDDVIVGARGYHNGQTAEGRVWVYHGSGSGLIKPAAFRAESNQAYARYGASVGTAGDVNGDGYDDVIVGAPSYDNGQTDEGRVWVYHGSIRGLTAPAAFRAEGNQAEAHYGHSVATAGDVNADGYADVIVGAFSYSNLQFEEGRVWVYHGSGSGLSVAAFTAESDQPGAYYGWSVATAGDVNGDGYDDVIVGAPFYDNGQTDEGRAWVYHGSISGLISPAAFTAESDWFGARYGWSVAKAGRTNADGYDDVIIGVPLFTNGQIEEGRAEVYHGPL